MCLFPSITTPETSYLNRVCRLVDVLLGVGQLDVEVAVDGDQAALVLGLAPLEPYYDVLVDAVRGAVLVVYWAWCYVFGHVSSSALEAVK